MNTELFREHSARLSLHYTRYLEALHGALFPGAPRAARAPAEKPEQRWESEGGKPH